eukprot:Selendium_serpulae@DN4273_c0_g1_i1.p1
MSLERIKLVNNCSGKTPHCLFWFQPDVSHQQNSSMQCTIDASSGKQQKPLRLLLSVRRLRSIFIFVLVPLCIWLYCWNLSYVLRQREAPLDHLFVSLKKPFFFFTCPKIATIDVPNFPKPFCDKRHKTKGEPLFNISDFGTLRSSQFFSLPVKIYIINARPIGKFLPIINCWAKAFGDDSVTIIDTHNISRDYENKRCRRLTWQSRINYVYQHVIRIILDDQRSAADSGASLSEGSGRGRDDLNKSGEVNSIFSNFNPLHHVLLLQDDALLLDPTTLAAEVTHVLRQNDEQTFGFYSLLPTGGASAWTGERRGLRRRRSCVYDYSAVAGLYSAQFLKQMGDRLETNDDAFCRYGFDINLAMMGPWYVTRNDVLKHVGTRLWVEAEAYENPQELGKRLPSSQIVLAVD